MDKELKLMLNQSILVEKFLSRDGAGEMTYAAPVSLACYLYGDSVMVRTVNNVEELSTLKAVIDGAGLQPGVNDRITPSSTKLAIPIKSIQPIYDEIGNLDTTIIFL